MKRLGVGLLAATLGGCALWQPAPPVEPPRCPAALAAPCEAPPALTSDRADGPGMVENHAAWVCGYWACAQRQRALAGCATSREQAPLPVPPRCRTQAAP